MKKIAVMCSGGDAPGMNACVRAVVRAGLYHKLEVMGIIGGYRGLLQNELVPMNSRSVSNTIQHGGTVIKTARSPEFMTTEGRVRAVATLERHGIEGLVVVGGDGSFRGAIELGKIWPGAVVGTPGTIDNDLWGTDETIGYDTALNTALEAVDKIRDTADAHERLFLIEVMGRHAGFLALNTALATGAEDALLPETKTDMKTLSEFLHDLRTVKKKASVIVIVAEGEEEGGAQLVADKLKAIRDLEYHVAVLGYIQRGGSPTARDRILATRTGVYAVELLLAGQTGVMAGEAAGRLVAVPFTDAVSKKKPVDEFSVKILPVLAV